jgi:hypothetical protein
MKAMTTNSPPSRQLRACRWVMARARLVIHSWHKWADYPCCARHRQAAKPWTCAISEGSHLQAQIGHLRLRVLIRLSTHFFENM